MPVERSLPRLRGSLVGLIRQRLWLQVLVGMALGVAFGVLIGPTGGLMSPRAAVLVGNWVGLPGTLFLLAIQFVVVPLVVASVIRGIAAGENTDSLGRLGGWTVGFFILTTLAAAAIGIGVALLLSPGQFVEGGTLNAALADAGGQEVVLDAPLGRLPILVRSGAVLPLAVEFPDVRPHDPGKVTLAAYPGGSSGEGLAAQAFFDDGESWQFRDGDASLLDLTLSWTRESVRLEGAERLSGGCRPELTITMVDPLARAGSIGGDFGMIPATWENRFPI